MGKSNEIFLQKHSISLKYRRWINPKRLRWAITNEIITRNDDRTRVNGF